LVGDHLLLRDFRPYGIIFMNACVIIVAMVMLLRDFGPYLLVKHKITIIEPIVYKYYAKEKV
jgi:hypothetical protein